MCRLLRSSMLPGSGTVRNWGPVFSRRASILSSWRLTVPWKTCAAWLSSPIVDAWGRYVYVAQWVPAQEVCY